MVAIMNQDFEIPGYCEVYLAAYPTGGYTGATLDLKIKNAYELFYTDGEARNSIKLTGQWANLDANGMSIKLKAGVVETDPQGGSKHPIAFQNLDADLEGIFYDCDVQHMADILSATSGEIITTASGVGKAGRKTLLVGSQKLLKKYAVMVRTVSLIEGEYDHWLFPRVVFSVDTDFKFSKKDPQACKFKITGLYDQTFLSPDNNSAVMAFKDVADTAAA